MGDESTWGSAIRRSDGKASTSAHDVVALRHDRPACVDVNDEQNALERRCEAQDELLANLRAELARSQQQCMTLIQGLASARLIGAAVGIVMATRGVDADVAFRILTRASQSAHVKLRRVAEVVVHTGDVSVLPNSEEIT